MLAPAMRPKFHAGISYVPVPEGVYIRGNNGSLLLKGASLYPLLEHLIPHLNGKATLEELTRGLDSRRKGMITQLIEKLLAHRFLQDVSQDQAPSLAPGVRERYSCNLAFLESLQTAATTRLAYMQSQRLLLSGCESACLPLIQAGLQCGVQQISVLLTSEEQARSRLRQEILECVARWGSCEQTVQCISPLDWNNEAEVRACLQDYDAVLHISARPARVQLLNRLCVAEQKTCIQAVIAGDRAWIGPLVCAQAQGCWECAWRRLQANQVHSQQPCRSLFCDPSPTADRYCPGMPEMTLLANRLLFALFTYYTHTGAAPIGEELSVLHLATGLSESHTFLPHPHCQACQHPAAPTAERFLEQIHWLEQRPPLQQDVFERGPGAAVVDPVLGLFTVQEGQTLAQAPLAIYTATLSDPLLHRSRPEVFTVAVVRRDRTDARLQVAADACARYAASLVDHRCLFPWQGDRSSPLCPVDQPGEQPVLPGRLGTWALDLQTQQACAVPAEHVFPALCHQDQGSTRGVAWGASWEEAVGRALLDRCSDLTVQRVTGTRQRYAPLDLAGMCLPAEETHLLHLLQIAIGQSLAVYDVTGSLGVPTFATCVGAQVVAYTTAWDEVRALGMGLLRALQQYQAEYCQQPAYALTAVPALPLALRGTQPSVPHYLLPDTWSARRAWLVQRLQAEGLRALVVPLDHDQALARILPFLVRVLVWRVEPQGGA